MPTTCLAQALASDGDGGGGGECSESGDEEEVDCGVGVTLSLEVIWRREVVMVIVESEVLVLGGFGRTVVKVTIVLVAMVKLTAAVVMMGEV